MYQDSMQYPKIMLMPLPLPSKWQESVQSHLMFHFRQSNPQFFGSVLPNILQPMNLNRPLFNPAFWLKYVEMLTPCSCLNYQ